MWRCIEIEERPATIFWRGIELDASEYQNDAVQPLLRSSGADADDDDAECSRLFSSIFTSASVEQHYRSLSHLEAGRTRALSPTSQAKRNSALVGSGGYWSDDGDDEIKSKSRFSKNVAYPVSSYAA